MIKVKNALKRMDYEEALESNIESLEWIAEHNGQFGHFIGGRFTKPKNLFKTINPFNEKEIAKISQGTVADIKKSVQAAKIGLEKWQSISPFQRSKYLYAIARYIQKESRTISVLESIENGKSIRESRDIDIPLAARHFYYHAGWAQLLDEEFQNYSAIGVCGQIIPWNFPILMLAWKVAPAIAAGNSVILKPAEQTSLTALYFAEICKRIKLPAGVVNVVTGDGITGSHLVTEKDVSKVAFTGSTEVGKQIKKNTAGSGKKLTLELGGKSPFIIFDDADLDSAVEGLVDAIWFNQGQVCCAGSRLLLQETISTKVEKKILSRMKKLRFGNPLDKSIDMGPLVSFEQQSRVKGLVDKGVESGADIFQCDIPSNLKGYFYPPTLLKNVSPSMEIFQKEIFGPVLSSTTFRTPEEAISLANNSRYGLSASIWSENINLALDIAPKLKVGVVWINSTNVFDAAVGFGGYRESGYGREGGKEGMYEYLKFNSDQYLIKEARVLKKNISVKKQSIPHIDQTRKMFIGGTQKRGDSGHSIGIFDNQREEIATVGRGNRKDIRNAVEAANKQMNWTMLSSHARAQIMFYIAENLSQRRDYFISLLSSTSLCQNPLQEFDTTLERLFTFASWADKFDGVVHQAPIRANTIALNEPVGVMGVICPDLAPLASFITLIAAALCQGNRLIVIPSENFPLPAVDMYQIFDTSDVPGAAINIVTGKHNELINTLSEHNSVDGIWNFGDSKYETNIDRASVSNLKQIWSINGNNVNWINYHASFNKLLLRKSSQVKNIWIPYGE